MDRMERTLNVKAVAEATLASESPDPQPEPTPEENFCEEKVFVV